jgi:hypothetical protein
MKRRRPPASHFRKDTNAPLKNFQHRTEKLQAKILKGCFHVSGQKKSRAISGSALDGGLVSKSFSKRAKS